MRIVIKSSSGKGKSPSTSLRHEQWVHAAEAGQGKQEAHHISHTWRAKRPKTLQKTALQGQQHSSDLQQIHKVVAQGLNISIYDGIKDFGKT